ncbi:hypothetical protein H920_01530 [Fukomys damarensis]|uniref:Uncharacterized protein n=1 Tax=Fukomys damarensis TaxID=885580 RepID=A0A091DY53_FUKDA|nr:hypothetical protein H920_01530 [Fukomys damarensis]
MMMMMMKMKKKKRRHYCKTNTHTTDAETGDSQGFSIKETFAKKIKPKNYLVVFYVFVDFNDDVIFSPSEIRHWTKYWDHKKEQVFSTTKELTIYRRDNNNQITTARRFLVQIKRHYDLVRNKDFVARYESDI